jgi:hypothetical protein
VEEEEGVGLHETHYAFYFVSNSLFHLLFVASGGFGGLRGGGAWKKKVPGFTKRFTKGGGGGKSKFKKMQGASFS